MRAQARARWPRASPWPPAAAPARRGGTRGAVWWVAKRGEMLISSAQDRQAKHGPSGISVYERPGEGLCEQAHTGVAARACLAQQRAHRSTRQAARAPPAPHLQGHVLRGRLLGAALGARLADRGAQGRHVLLRRRRARQPPRARPARADNALLDCHKRACQHKLYRPTPVATDMQRGPAAGRAPPPPRRTREDEREPRFSSGASLSMARPRCSAASDLLRLVSISSTMSPTARRTCAPPGGRRARHFRRAGRRGAARASRHAPDPAQMP